MTHALIRSHRPFSNVLDQFFDDGFFAPAFGRRGTETLSERTFSPAVDLSQTDEEYRVHVDLPGLSKDDISLTVEDDTLTLTGERQFETQEEGESYNRVERTFGKFSRTFQLPANADSSAVKATFEDGVLTVTLGKKEEAKPREIAVD